MTLRADWDFELRDYIVYARHELSFGDFFASSRREMNFIQRIAASK